MRQITGVTDKEKIESFGDHLKSGSPAEEWYSDTATPKATWAAFEAAFQVRFPGVVKAKKTGTDLERDLAAMRLKPGDLGKTEKFGGEEVWTHMVFADKALDLAKRAGIDNGSSSIWAVRDHLPDIIKEKVGESQTSWHSFCNAIKAVELGHIRDGVKKYKEMMAEKEVMTARLARLESAGVIAPPSPTAGIRNQMSRTTISANQPNQAGGGRPANNANPNPFNAGGGGRGNLFAPGAPRAPATEAQKQAVRTRIATYPLQPDTPAGQGAYREQLRAWRGQFGDQKATEVTGFPLCPGSDPPASGECYACGRVGHN